MTEEEKRRIEWQEFTKTDFYSGLDILAGEDPVAKRIKSFEEYLEEKYKIVQTTEGEV